VDGNRTRLDRITADTRFEGGGAHQVPGHLPGGGETLPVRAVQLDVGYLVAMKKLLLLAALLGLTAVAVRKLRVG
jgi:hypothetical protein